MAEFQLLRCMVALGGDRDNVVYRHRGNPIMFPELPLLQHIHGDDAITEVHVVGTCDMSNDEALTRLRIIYRDEYIKEVYPGTRPRLPTADGTIPPCTLPLYVPRTVRPDNPDPKLKPLDLYTMSDSMPRVEAPELPDEDEPTIDEIAAHAQDEDELPDEDILGVARPVDVTSVQAPDVQDVPQTRVSFRGQARQARRTATHLPDVQARTRNPEEHDHDRARG